MASATTLRDVERRAEEIAQEIDRLQADHAARIDPAAFDRHKARAAELRTEALRLLLRRARDAGNPTQRG